MLFQQCFKPCTDSCSDFKVPCRIVPRKQYCPNGVVAFHCGDDAINITIVPDVHNQLVQMMPIPLLDGRDT